MKHLMPVSAAIAVVIVAVPALAQTPCDSLAAAGRRGHSLTSVRHQVLAPRDSARLGTRGTAARRVRMADGSVRVQRYVTKSGVPVAKQKPVACPVVAAAGQVQKAVYFASGR